MSAPDQVLVGADPRPVGVAYIECPACEVTLPLTVEVWLATDEDGDECVFTDTNTLDYEAHLASHGPLVAGGPPE